ncbi:helix-turn-helix domain-containing protein [Streptomyces odonnellii]|uniref:helix-turn-helix domain-containing protein n=1 Tax=Streptomyces odonnellii TaxID=1417980 RepID=UPI000626D4D5|nr:helix-turn-helix transcriptional regulator [Streptomyces odonnellii]
MTGFPGFRVGDRVKYYRKTNGHRSQAVVAGLCGITERYLSLIENGQKTPSADVLSRLASELGVPIAALLSDTPGPEPVPTDRTASDVARALMGYGRPPVSTPVVPPADLRERVEQAWRTWQTSKERFTEAEVTFPALIEDVEHALRAYRRGTDPAVRRDVLRTAADLYGLLRSYCRRTGRLDLSLMAADRAIRAAEDADDPVRIAAAQWNLGHVLLSDERDGAVGEAKDVALAAVDRIKSEAVTLELTAVQGALELVAVVSDARQRNWWQARERLEKRAAPLGDEAGEGNVQRTVFGPTNVELHAMSVEMLAGEAAEALRLADHLDTTGLPSRERRFTFGLEVARCYDLRREDAAVYVHLLGLEGLAPEDLAHSPQARGLVAGLRKRVRPTYKQQVTELADRLGVI